MDARFLYNAKSWISLANENIEGETFKTAAVELLLAVKWLDVAEGGKILSRSQADDISRIIDEIL